MNHSNSYLPAVMGVKMTILFDLIVPSLGKGISFSIGSKLLQSFNSLGMSRELTDILYNLNMAVFGTPYLRSRFAIKSAAAFDGAQAHTFTPIP